MQEQLKNCIDCTMMTIQRACKTKEAKNQFNLLINEVLMTNNISHMQLNLPSTGSSNLYIFNLFKENMTKFKRFTTTILNPGTIADLILKFGHLSVNQVDSEAFTNAIKQSKPVDLREATD